MAISKPQFATLLKVSLAKNGTGHWWLQRITAIALIPLSYFVIRLFAVCTELSYSQAVAWLSFPINTLGLLLWLLLVFYHAALGVQVVIEDYVANLRQQKLVLWASNGIFILLAVAAVWAVIRIVSAG
jgi:succinate dehydrogenase / fumarate reductase, membrane anchor subunit